MAFIEPFQFETPKEERARLLVAGALWLNVIIVWGVLISATRGSSAISGPALVWMAPSIAALITLLRHKGLDGAKIARVVAYGYVFVVTIFGTVAMIFSGGHRAPDRLLGLAMIVTVLAIQMTIPAAILWARSELTLWQAFARYIRVFAIAVPIMVVGLLFT